MKVKLISVTPNAEKQIMYCARVSSPKQDSGNPKLLKYCIDHGHWSVFEMANMCLEIETSRAISAQLLRHKSFSAQEFSQRYSETTGFEVHEPRSQDHKNRQNSIDNVSKEDRDWFVSTLIRIQTQSDAAYKEAIKRGIAKECARFLLPLSTTTKLYMNGTVRSWIHYLQVRCDSSTQLEHREIARAAREIFSKEFPNISQALGWAPSKC